MFHIVPVSNEIEKNDKGNDGKKGKERKEEEKKQRHRCGEIISNIFEDSHQNIRATLSPM